MSYLYEIFRVRNPHGMLKAFSGRWSPNSDNWKNVSDTSKLNLLSYIQNDGQFIISLDEFLVWFDELNVVHIQSYQKPKTVNYNPNSGYSTNNFNWYTPGIRYNGINNPVYEHNGQIINDYLKNLGIN